MTGGVALVEEEGTGTGGKKRKSDQSTCAMKRTRKGKKGRKGLDGNREGLAKRGG